jgi:hypothetical protein
MALKWIDGAEGWEDGTYATRAYADTNLASTATPGRVSPGTRYWNLNTSRAQTPSLGVQNTWIVGLGLFLANTGAFTVKFFSGGTEQCRFEIENSGGLPRWKLMRGATQIGSASATFALNQWFFFEFKVDVLTSGAAYEARQNEVQIMSGSGANLANGGANGADSIGFGYAGLGRMDDIYVCDSTGSVNNNFLGDVVAVHILPAAEGHQIDFTPSTGTNNAALVDETTASAADFNSSDTNTHEDYYTFADLPPTGLGTILGIRASGTWAMASTGSRVCRYRYYNGSTEFTIGANFSAATTTLVELPQIIEVNPNTGVAWTKTEIDAAEFGVEVVS